MGGSVRCRRSQHNVRGSDERHDRVGGRGDEDPPLRIRDVRKTNLGTAVWAAHRLVVTTVDSTMFANNTVANCFVANEIVANGSVANNVVANEVVGGQVTNDE